MTFLNMGAAEKSEAKARDSRRAVFPSRHGRVVSAAKAAKPHARRRDGDNRAMLRFAANVSMLFTEAPFLDRFALAARAGFAAVECQFPYEAPAAEIRARLDDAGLAMVLHNLPAGDWAAGERGLACRPDRADEFRAGVTRAIGYAHALGVTQLNCLAGIAPPDVGTDTLYRTLVDNLRFAARAFAAEGLKLLVEPINTFDIPGFLVNRTGRCVALLDEVGEPNAFVQYDAYHMQRMEGELVGTLTRHLPRIAHVQVADNPGRHEPGTGEIRFEFLFAELERLGYAGWIGCEYKPAGRTADGLGWLPRGALAAPR
jgi:hydroxypyruvate isomerase